MSNGTQKHDYVLTFQSQKGIDVCEEIRKGTIDLSDVKRIVRFRYDEDNIVSLDLQPHLP